MPWPLGVLDATKDYHGLLLAHEFEMAEEIGERRGR